MISRPRKPAAAAVALVLMLTSFLAMPINAYANADVLQCMADCIKSEGKAEKATCKSRCADIPVSTQPENKDCMATFKQCKKTCEGDKDCKKVCKTTLLNCV